MKIIKFGGIGLGALIVFTLISLRLFCEGSLNSKHRIQVTPSKRGRGRKALAQQRSDEKTPAQRHLAMTWMQRLKRVFNIDIEICEKCKGPSRSLPVWKTR